MDGSRGATGAVDVGVSHLNMNINVIGGGHGLGSSLASGGDKGAAGGDSKSSSPPVGGTTEAATSCAEVARAYVCGAAVAPRVLSQHISPIRRLSLFFSPPILYLLPLPLISFRKQHASKRAFAH